MLGLDIAYMCAKFDRRSGDMAGYQQNFNGSRHLTRNGLPFVDYSTCYDQSIYSKFEVSISTHNKDMNSDTEYRKWGG